MEVALNDKKYFELSIGKRVLKRAVFQSNGQVPVYSANVSKPFGFLERTNKSVSDFEHDYILWGIDGNFEFNIMPKGKTFAATDHCGTIKILDANILPEYVIYQLELKKHEYGFDRSLRASLNNIRNVVVNIPKNDSVFDRTAQEVVVKKYRLIRDALQDIKTNLTELKNATIHFEEESVSSQFIELSLDNKKYFRLQRGRRITKKDCVTHPGDIPVVSGRGVKNSYLGYVAEDWLKEQNIPTYDKPMIVIAANGSVGTVFLRDEPKYTIHDDTVGIIVNDPTIKVEYLQYALRNSVIKAQFYYNAKIYQKTLSSLKVKIPVDGNGLIDVTKQDKFAKKNSALNVVKEKLSDLTQELEEEILITMS